MALDVTQALAGAGIYLIRNTKTQTVYVGSAVNVVKRWQAHRRSLAQKKHHSIILQRAWDKYGAAAFVFEIIEPVRNALHLKPIEQVYLDYYRRGKTYNVCARAESRRGVPASAETRKKLSVAGLGRTVSAETRSKLREQRLGVKCSAVARQNMGAAQVRRALTYTPTPATRAKMSAALQGNTHTKGRVTPDSTREKIRKAMLGRVVSEETRARQSEASRGRVCSAETRAKIAETLRNKPRKNDPAAAERASLRVAPYKRAIAQIDRVTGLVIKTYASVKDAGRAGFCVPHVTAVAQGRGRSSGGFSWAYVPGVE